jgi:hypothetical protein
MIEIFADRKEILESLSPLTGSKPNCRFDSKAIS